MDTPGRFEEAIRRMDEINTADPNRVEVEGETVAKELLYSERMSRMALEFQPDASEPLQLAARAQHIARWRVERTDYRPGLAGYHAWRIALMEMHAQIAGRILKGAGYDAETVDRVRGMLMKRGMKKVSEVQALEDVACLVFLKHYLTPFLEEHDYGDDRVVSILRKTWDKMSNRGRESALQLDLGTREQSLLERALQQQ